jgi:hypothetical protein
VAIASMPSVTAIMEYSRSVTGSCIYRKLDTKVPVLVNNHTLAKAKICIWNGKVVRQHKVHDLHLKIKKKNPQPLRISST